MSNSVFISWSGELSHKVALALYDWLPSIIQTVDLFLSSEDVEKGTPWFSEIGSKLEQTNFGILCITPDNMNAPWILFEAGALSKSLGRGRVSPLLIGLTNSDLSGPLAQLNTTSLSESEIKKLFTAINRHLDQSGIPEKRFEKAFNFYWPSFKAQIDQALIEAEGSLTKAPNRDPQDKLDEILVLARSIAQGVSKQPEDREEDLSGAHERIREREKTSHRDLLDDLYRDSWPSGDSVVMPSKRKGKRADVAYISRDEIEKEDI
jgi:hypothetical protein